MSEFKGIEVIHGSGNAFKDFGIANADVEQKQSYIGCAHYKLAR